MSRYQFACMERGCGVCEVRLIDALVSETSDTDGRLIASESAPRLVSTCCGAGFVIWDNQRDDDALEQVVIRPAHDAQEPLHPAVLVDWLAARYRAAGGKEGITDLSAFCEEVMRWTETKHGIAGAKT